MFDQGSHARLSRFLAHLRTIQDPGGASIISRLFNQLWSVDSQRSRERNPLAQLKWNECEIMQRNELGNFCMSIIDQDHLQDWKEAKPFRGSGSAAGPDGIGQGPIMIVDSALVFCGGNDIL